MKTIFAFFVLGVMLGMLLNVNSLLSIIISNKIASVALDVFMMIVFSFLYFSVMLAYNNGTFYFRYMLVSFFGFFMYFLIFFKPINKVFNFIGGKLNKSVKFVSKKLNFGKKYRKNLLHNKGK